MQKKRTLFIILLITILNISIGCADLDRRETPTASMANDIVLEDTPLPSPLLDITPTSTSSPTPMPTPSSSFMEPPPYWEEDLGRANIDSSLCYFSLDDTELPSESDTIEKKLVQEKASIIMDEYISRIHNSITEKKEISLVDLYDISNDVRKGDLLLNQLYIYSKIAGSTIHSSTYDGGRHRYSWINFDFESNSGMIVGYVSPIITISYSGSGTITNGSMENPHFPHEFALIMHDGEVKVIRHRYYDFDFSAIQKLMLENPDLLENPNDFRNFLLDRIS